MSCKKSWEVMLTMDEIRLIRRGLYEKIHSVTKDLRSEVCSTFCDDLYWLCCELERYAVLLKRFSGIIDEKKEGGEA